MIKRLFDIVFSVIGLIALSPMFFLVALWIKIDSQGGVIFRQVRVGLYGKSFRIHKFRTMIIDAENQGRLTIGDDERITRSGKFLRKYKIDELPQLIDVLLGQMSFVGPRPEVEEFMNMYSSDVRGKVLSVKPGVTDMASIVMIDENEILSKYIDARYAYANVILPIKQRYYIEYVNNHSIWIDIKIILLTFKKIIFR
jgi:lipopolysaccharide/colanic/teichoic acid biosynthesis glycosyltransferase